MQSKNRINFVISFGGYFPNSITTVAVSKYQNTWLKLCLSTSGK